MQFMTTQKIQSPECRFCRIMDGHTFNGEADLPFDESHDFVSLASIGAIIEGWSLVVPKKHCLSLRDHYGTSEFSSFVRTTIQRVELMYGPVVLFEHGANHCGSLTSCGTDHAHFHIVPQQFPLFTMLDESGIAAWQQIRASEIRSQASNGEYLFFSVNHNVEDPLGYFKKLDQPSSQFFRKAIAAAIGKSSVADYKAHPHLDITLKTRERLTEAA